MNNIKDLQTMGKIVVIPTVLIFAISLLMAIPLIKHIIEFYGLYVITTGITESFDIIFKVAFVIAGISLLPILTYAIYWFMKPVINLKGYIKTIILSEILAIFGFVIGSTYFTKLIITSLDKYNLVIGYYSLSNILTFGIGIGFAVALCLQLIILIPLLCKFKIIDSKKLLNINILSILFVGGYFLCAFLTPPDLTSTFMLMMPMSVSYFIGTGIAKTQKNVNEVK